MKARPLGMLLALALGVTLASSPAWADHGKGRHFDRGRVSRHEWRDRDRGHGRRRGDGDRDDSWGRGSAWRGSRGFDHGRKNGWRGAGLPPGQARKFGSDWRRDSHRWHRDRDGWRRGDGDADDIGIRRTAGGVWTNRPGIVQPVPAPRPMWRR